MRIAVTAVPGARATRVERIENGAFRVSVTAPARQGRANTAVIEALAEYFAVPRSRVRIIRGQSTRHKVVDIE